MAAADPANVAFQADITKFTVGLFVLGVFLPPDDPRVLPELDEAIEVGTRIGDRRAVATAVGNKGWMAARHGDWYGALHAARDFDEMRLHFKLSDQTNPGSFALTPVVLVELGHFEPATVLLGYYDAAARGMPGPPRSLEMLATRRATLTMSVREHESETLLARGAGLSPVEAAAYLRAAIDQALEKI